jgi:hypothetical protein
MFDTAEMVKMLTGKLLLALASSDSWFRVPQDS